MDTSEEGIEPDGPSAVKPWHFKVLVPIFLVVFGILASQSSIREIHQAQWRAILRGNSQVAFGEVTELFVGRGGNAFVRYRFSVDGTTYYGDAQLPRHYSTAGLHESDGIFIRFLPSNPAVNHPYAWERSVFMDLDSMIGGGIFVVLGVSAVVILFTRRRLGNREPVAAEQS